jgi:hypothetical protein
MAERGGIRSEPSSTSADEHYTSGIVACVYSGYKRIRSQATVSIVFLIGRSSTENGITGISDRQARLAGTWPSHLSTRRLRFGTASLSPVGLVYFLAMAVVGCGPLSCSVRLCAPLAAASSQGLFSYAPQVG